MVASFSRLNVVAQAAVLAVALMVTQALGPAGRGTLHLLPVLMAVETQRAQERPAGARRRRPRTGAGFPPPAARSPSPRSRCSSPRSSTPRTSTSRPTTSPRATQREVALAFAGPLREVSMALRLDRPRAWVESATGRRHATIDTEIALPPPPRAVTDTTPVTGSPPAEEGRGPARTEPGEPATPRRPTFSPEDPMRVWVAGDSLVITPGYAVYRALDQNDAVESHRRRRRPRRHRPDPPRRLQLVSPRRRRGAQGEGRRGRPRFRRQRRPRGDDRRAEGRRHRRVRRRSVDEGVPSARGRPDGHRQPGRGGRRLARAPDHE